MNKSLKKQSQAKQKLFTAITALTILIGSADANAGWFSHIAMRSAEHKISNEVVSRAENNNFEAPRYATNSQGFLGCTQLFPGNEPIKLNEINTNYHPVGLCSNNFAVVYSTLTKTPLVVIEKLNREMLENAKGEERSNAFFPDPRLAVGQRAELSDFKGTRYDRGHMANAADQPDHNSMIQSFSLANMVAQDPENNRHGAWSKAEKDTRKYVKRATGNVYVFSGPLFIGKSIENVITIGANKVWVPTHLFKLVYDESTGRAWAHIMENNAWAQLTKPISYQEFVAQTGWHFLDSRNLTIH